MKKYLSFFRIRFVTSLQYRAAAFAGAVTQFFWGMMELLMFSAFMRSDPSAFPMTFEQIASYTWLQQAFLALFAPWTYEQDILNVISDGSIACELVRPTDIYLMWYSKCLASRCSKALLKSIPIFAVVFFLPSPFRMRLPNSAANFAAFIVSMILAVLVVVSFSMFVYISCFHTISSSGIRTIITTAAEFLAGGVIPLPFFPDGIRQVLELLPFASMQNLPLRIYSGNIAGADAVTGILLQLFWFIFLSAAGWLWMKKSLKKVIVQGG